MNEEVTRHLIAQLNATYHALVEHSTAMTAHEVAIWAYSNDYITAEQYDAILALPDYELPVY